MQILLWGTASPRKVNSIFQKSKVISPSRSRDKKKNNCKCLTWPHSITMFKFKSVKSIIHFIILGDTLQYNMLYVRVLYYIFNHIIFCEYIHFFTIRHCKCEVPISFKGFWVCFNYFWCNRSLWSDGIFFLRTLRFFVHVIELPTV